jgi:integrase
MRHTAATLWLASGEAPEWIARQLGHTSTEMLFRVYSRYVPNLTRQDGSAMERLLASQMSQGALLPQTTPGSDVAVYVPAQDVAPMPQPKLRGVNGVRRVVGAGGVHPVPKDRSVHQTHNTNSVVGVGTDSPGTSALAQPPPVGWWFQSGALMSHHTHQHLNQP